MLEFTLNSGWGFAGHYYKISGYKPDGDWFSMLYYGYAKRDAIAKFRADNGLQRKHICFSEW